MYESIARAEEQKQARKERILQEQIRKIKDDQQHMAESLARERLRASQAESSNQERKLVREDGLESNGEHRRDAESVAPQSANEAQQGAGLNVAESVPTLSPPPSPPPLPPSPSPPPTAPRTAACSRHVSFDDVHAQAAGHQPADGDKMTGDKPNPPRQSGSDVPHSHPPPSGSDMVSILQEFRDMMREVCKDRALERENYRREQHEAERRHQALIRDIRRMQDAKQSEQDDHAGQPTKLRMDGVPHWPPTSKDEGVYPFCIFAEDFSAALKILGLAHALAEKDKETQPITAKQHALALRYIIASMTDPTIGTHLASNYTSGQDAWQYLNKSFGLQSLGQSVLRRNIEDLRVVESDEPHVVIMMMERLAGRLDPPMQQSELSEQLMNKLPRAWKHIGTTIRGMQKGCMDNFSGPGGVKEMFIDLVKEENDTPQYPCRRCGKYGHYANQCPRPKANCGHPLCVRKGEFHMKKFCFFYNPEACKDPDLRQRKMAELQRFERAEKLKTAGKAAGYEANPTHYEAPYLDADSYSESES